MMYHAYFALISITQLEMVKAMIERLRRYVACR